MNSLPPVLYHATPPENVESILRDGLVPPEQAADLGPDGVHRNRVFLSRFDDPSYMNLPSDKIAGAAVLAVDTSRLDPSRMYPDDSIYAAYFNDQLDDDEIGRLFPRHRQEWEASGTDMDFGEWMDENGPGDEMERLLAGRFGITLWNSEGLDAPFDLGEIGYEGRIPPGAISVHRRTASGQYLYHCTLADYLPDIAEQGLDPAHGGTNFPTGGPDDPSGWVRGKLFFAEDPDRALYFGENAMARLWGTRKTPPVMLRVPRSAVEVQPDRYGDFYTEGTVPPSLIEVKAPTDIMDPNAPWGWEPLTSEVAEEARDTFAGEYLGRDEPLYLAPDFSPKKASYSLPGTLYHGTFWVSDDEPFTDLTSDMSDWGAVWAADTESDAEWFANWRDPDPDDTLVVFRLSADIRPERILSIDNATWQGRGWLDLTGMGRDDPYEEGDESDFIDLGEIGDFREIYDLARGRFDAVVIPDNYANQGGGADIAVLDDSLLRVEAAKLSFDGGDSWTDWMSPEEAAEKHAGRQAVASALSGAAARLAASYFDFGHDRGEVDFWQFADGRLSVRRADGTESHEDLFQESNAVAHGRVAGERGSAAILPDVPEGVKAKVAEALVGRFPGVRFTVWDSGQWGRGGMTMQQFWRGLSHAASREPAFLQRLREADAMPPPGIAAAAASEAMSGTLIHNAAGSAGGDAAAKVKSILDTGVDPDRWVRPWPGQAWSKHPKAAYLSVAWAGAEDNPPPNYVFVEPGHLSKPLVLWGFDADGNYVWGDALNEAAGKSGQSLTSLLRRHGFDSIVTVRRDDGTVGEVAYFGEQPLPAYLPPGDRMANALAAAASAVLATGPAYAVELTENDNGGVSATVLDEDGEQVDDAYGDMHMGQPDEFQGEGAERDHFHGDEPIEEDGPVAILTGIELPKEIRGLGLGRRMVEDMCRWVFVRGAQAVYTHASGSPGDPDPAGFYEALGFHEVGMDWLGNPYMKLGRPGKVAAVEDIYRGVKEVTEKYRGKGLFARFSDVPKVGIRPSTEHHDPYGVYFYPIDWLAENAGWGTTYINLPYITVARIRRSGWLNLATVRPARARELAEKGGVLEEYEARTSGKGLNRAKGGRAGKRLWDAVEDKVKPFESESNKMEWNRIFGRMGVKAIYDPGTGSVNEREPAQIVVLDLSLIEVVDVVENREDRKSVFHALLKGVADEMLDEGWRVAGSHAEGGIWAGGAVGGAPVELSVMPARGGFNVEVTLSYHDKSGKKHRVTSGGRMPNEWEDAPAAYLAGVYAESLRRKLEGAEMSDVAPAGEDPLDALDGALRAFTRLRLPDISAEAAERGASFFKNTGDGKVEGSLKLLPDGRREMELYAEDWFFSRDDDDSWVAEIGPMRVSWEGDPAAAAADMTAELAKAVREARLTDMNHKPKEIHDRDALKALLKVRTLGSVFPQEMLEAAGVRDRAAVADALARAASGLAQQLWHGSSGENIRAIAAAGYVDPGVPEGEPSRGFQTPMPGRTYATTDPGYALMYAIGANMVGKELPEGRGFDGEGGAALLEAEGDPLPDEDWVGEVIADCENWRRKQRGDPNAYGGEPAEWRRRAYDRLRSALPARTVSMIDRKPTWKLHEMATQSMLGKNVNRWLLTLPADNTLRQTLVGRSPHHSYPGRLRVLRAWVFPIREANPKLEKDGSNLAEVATEIPVAPPRRAGALESRCWADAKEALAAGGFENLDGMCLEASAVLCHRLREEGEPAQMVRRWSDEHGGHWTVRTPAGEFDPTVSWWEDPPPGSSVGEGSPHLDWEEDPAPNEREAVAVALNELGVDDFEELYDAALERRVRASGPLRAYHGTSDAYWPLIEESGGLDGPYLARTPELAQYYAEVVAEDDGGNPVVLEVVVRDTSKLRYDRAAMDEPVTVGVDEEDRDAERGRAEEEHPEWVHGGMISIPPEEWEYSWRGAHSARYDGLLPLSDIGSRVASHAEISPGGVTFPDRIPDAVRREVAEVMSGACVCERCQADRANKSAAGLPFVEGESPTKSAAMSDILTRVRPGFDRWVAQADGDRDSYWLAEYLQGELGLSVRDDGLVEFESLDPRVRKAVGDLPAVVYHHTSDAILPAVRSEGLRPGEDVNRWGAPCLGVYVTTEATGPAAEGYLSRACDAHGGDPVTLEIRTTLDRLTPDENDEDIASGRRQFVLPSVAPQDILSLTASASVLLGRAARAHPPAAVRFGGLSEAVRADITEGLHGALFSDTDMSPEILREVLDDMDPDIPLLRLPAAGLAAQARARWSLSDANIRALADKLRSGRALDPVLMDGGRLFEGGHRAASHEAAGLAEVPALDISALLDADWESEMGEEVPGLARRAAGQRMATAADLRRIALADYPRAGETVDGRRVMDHVPNLSSISASFEEWDEMPGIREVPMSDFGGPKTVFYAADDFRRSRELAAAIRESGEIAPLIVAVDDEGPYILEGGHRFVALHVLGAKSFPAVVVVDMDDNPDDGPPDGRQASAGLRFRHECVGAHHGQVDMVLRAESDERLVGYISYAIFNGEAVIGHVEVAEGMRRRGIATAMLRDLEREAAGDGLTVRHTGTTPDGAAWLSAAAPPSPGPGPRWYYHGTAPDDILDVAQWGLLAREDRDGVSVTTDPERAEFWGGLKAGGRREVVVLRIPASALPDLTPEDAAPAEPDKDFTGPRQIPPEDIEIRKDGSWEPILDAYGEFLDPDDPYSEYGFLGRASRPAATAPYYHGTTAAALRSIEQEGKLRAPVYLADSRAAASEFAEMAADDSRSRAVVLEVSLPPDAAAELRPDPDFDEGSGNFVLDRAVPLEWVPWYPDPDEILPLASALARAARALGEHLGDTVPAYRALGAEHAEAVIRSGFTGEHHRSGVYYTTDWNRACFYARFMPRGRWGVILEMEADTSRSTLDANDMTDEQSTEAFDGVREAAGEMQSELRRNLEEYPPALDSDIEAWVGSRVISDGYYEAPEHASIWQLVAEAAGVTPAEAREALPPGTYGGWVVLDERGIAGADPEEGPGAQGYSEREVPADRLRAAWLPQGLLEAVRESPPAGSESRADHVDVIPAQFQPDDELVAEIERQVSENLRRAEEPDSEGDAEGQQVMPWGEERPMWGRASDAEDVASWLSGILSGWRDEGDASVPGHIYSKLMRGEDVTIDDLGHEERLFRYALPQDGLKAIKALRKAGQAGALERAAAKGENMSERHERIARALRRAADDIGRDGEGALGWSEESDVDPDDVRDEGFVPDDSGHTFWGSRGSGCLFVRNHPEEGPQLLAVHRSPHVEEPNTWGTTGGAVPKGEQNIFASAIRETREEIGSIPRYSPVRKYVWKATGGTFTYTTFILECQDMDWLPDAFNWEAVDAKWVSLEEAASLDLHFGLAAILSDLGEGVFPSAAKAE